MTIKTKTNYIQDRYMNLQIKCNADHPTFESILEPLYILTYEAADTLGHPKGFHVRTRFTTKMSVAEYTARINNYYEDKSNYKPLKLTVIENDETGTHHHHAFVLNGSKDKKYSLHHIHAKLKEEGKLSDYSIIAPKHDPYGHNLETIEDRDSYFKWMTYLAKKKSKPDRPQIWSASRKVTTLLKNWRKQGKPNLRTRSPQNPNSSQNDLSAFID